MPKLIACMAGLVALIAGIIGNVNPVFCLQRAVIAAVLGGCAGALWQAMLGNPVPLKVVESEQKDSEPQTERSKAA
jgi:hypothetical protein